MRQTSGKGVTDRQLNTAGFIGSPTKLGVQKDNRDSALSCISHPPPFRL